MDKTEKALSEAIQRLIPKSLDDVIRDKRDSVRLRLATAQEITDLKRSIEAGPVNPGYMMNDWRLIVLELLTEPGDIQMMLLGSLPDGDARITSLVRQIDLDKGLVITNSGSLYGLANKGDGEPPFHHLAMVCCAFHEWGFGRTLGVPEFFY